MGSRLRAVLPLAAAFVIVLGVGLFALDEGREGVVGDEPHYLVMARSLITDGDFDLADDYRRLDPHIHAFHYRDGGPLAPVHGVGTAVMIAPFTAVRDTLDTARFGMVVYTALLGAVLLSLLRAVAGRGRRSRAALLVWAAVVTTLPMVVFSYQVYPDVLGALFVALALRLLLVPEFRARHAVAVGLCAAWLPFLHVRFGIFTLALAPAAAIRAARAAPTRHRAWTILPAAVPVAAGLLLLAGLFWHLYGSPMPGAPYDIEPYATDNRFTPLKAYRFGLGSLMGWTTGLIPFAPVFWFGVAGLAWFGRELGRWAPALVGAVGVVYMVVVGGHGPIVNAFPGRTMLVFVPVLALGLLGAVHASRLLAAAVVAVAVLSAAMSYEGIRNLPLLFDTGELRLSIPRRLAPAFPWFTVPPGGSRVAYDLPDLPHETGRVVDDAVVADAAAGDRAGTLVTTERTVLRAGMYQLDLGVSATGAGRVLEVRVVNSFDRQPYGEWTLWAPDLAGKAVTSLPLTIPDLQQFQVEIAYTGEGAVRLASAELRPAGRGLVPVRTASSDAPLTAVWIALTAFVMTLLARTPPARSRRSDPDEADADPPQTASTGTPPQS